MIKLNLERLNNHSPYLLWRDDDGDLFFETDEGLLYCLELEENYETLQYDSCVFGIINKDRKWSHGDTKLKQTVLCVIEEFFKSNNRVLLYICSTFDNKQEIRFRLFLRWFNTYNKKDQYLMRTINGVLDENIPDYAAIIVERNNPDLEYILQRLDELIDYLKK